MLFGEWHRHLSREGKMHSKTKKTLIDKSKSVKSTTQSMRLQYATYSLCSEPTGLYGRSSYSKSKHTIIKNKLQKDEPVVYMTVMAVVSLNRKRYTTYCTFWHLEKLLVNCVEKSKRKSKKNKKKIKPSSHQQHSLRKKKKKSQKTISNTNGM